MKTSRNKHEIRNADITYDSGKGVSLIRKSAEKKPAGGQSNDAVGNKQQPPAKDAQSIHDVQTPLKVINLLRRNCRAATRKIDRNLTIYSFHSRIFVPI